MDVGSYDKRGGVLILAGARGFECVGGVQASLEVFAPPMESTCLKVLYPHAPKIANLAEAANCGISH